MSGALARLANAGVERTGNRKLAKRVHLTNRIAIVVGSTALPFIVAYAVGGLWWPLFAANLLALLSYYAVIAMNARGWFYASRWHLVVSSDLLLLFSCYQAGKELGVQSAFFVMACLPLVVFDLEDRLSIFINMAVPVIAYFSVEALPQFEGVVPPEQLLFGRFGEAVLIFSALIYIVYHFRTVNERYEKELENLVQQLSEHQQRLTQTSKMSALGEMAAGIAHEINNPLAVIQLRTDSLKAQARRGELRPEQVNTSLQAIEQTVRRISRIIDGLRSFAREADDEPLSPEPVSKIVEDTFELCSARFRSHGVDVTVGDVPADLRIRCRPVQIAQILLNLLNNAFDAVGASSEKWIRVEVRAEPTVVKIAVTDSGEGIAEPVREKLFQPFFTTKGVGHGTGLGLSISKGLAESQGGALALNAASPRTQFVLSVPRDLQ